MIGIISATRDSEEKFWSESALGISLLRLSGDRRIRACICYGNARGLSDVYNDAIAAAADEDSLVFVHDDVWIDDYFLVDRVETGLSTYDVIGVAGNRRRVENQPGWAFVNDRFTWDEKSNLSGSIAHGPTPFGDVANFGPGPSECELLDGVFLAAKTATLRKHRLTFDSRFKFHFYDLDFCRSARALGLRLGTWPICLTHKSAGSFDGEQWRLAYAAYLNKWQS